MKYVTCYHCLSTQLFMLGYAKMTKISISQLQLLHYFVFLLFMIKPCGQKSRCFSFTFIHKIKLKYMTLRAHYCDFGQSFQNGMKPRSKSKKMI